MTETDASQLIDRLSEVIESRRSADPAVSYVAKLLHEGRAGIAKKVGEEGVELALAGAAGGRDEVIAESADLLFHMMVLWAHAGVTPEDVLQELARREGVSGLAEKRARTES
jgi:phosphoribosyl-ATP pyrophosphohydrolase